MTRAFGTSLVRLGALLLAVIFLGPALLAAGRHDDVPAGLKEKIRHRQGGAIAVETLPLETLDAGDSLKLGWHDFVRRKGGKWKVFVEERTGLPTRLSGSGLRWFVPEALEGLALGDVEARARAFLADNASLLGRWDAVLELDTAASLELAPDHWQLIFRQVVDGVRVENARLDLHVKQGRMVMFGAQHWGPVRVSGVPTLDVDAARSALDAHLGQPSWGFEQVAEPRLQLVALAAPSADTETRAWNGPRGEGLEHALVWRFEFRDPNEAPLWVAEVDAHDGTILAFYDDARYGQVRGGVFPIAADGDCAEGGCEVAGFPMPFADYTESGQPETDADAFGNMQCVNSTAPASTGLSNQYVWIDDLCGPTLETGTCDGGIDLGLKGGEDCDVEPGASAGNSAAGRTAFYHINRAAELARFYDPANTWLQSQLRVIVNMSSTCNAFWNDDLNMNGEGGGCRNTAESQGLLVHEWGHGYDENDGGGFDNTSEAYADVVSIFAARESCVARGHSYSQNCTGYGDTCLDCTGLRDMDWAARQNNTPTTPSNYIVSCPSGPGGPCGRESHCESYPPSETIFDIATRDLPASGLDAETSWQLAERLWYLSRPGSGGDIYNCFRLNLAHSCDATSWMQRMLVVDDDDGNLANGTPNAAAIFAAFERHDISCGSVSDPENQSTSSCPSLAAPSLMATELVSGTDLSWTSIPGAAEYRVYRGDLGCERQQIPIATPAGGTTSFLDAEADQGLPRYYRVEAFGSNPVCHSPVSNCVATGVGARIQLNELKLLESGPSPNGFPDPGETLQLPVTLFNGGLDPATAPTGTLRLVDPDQGRVIDTEATWPALPQGTALDTDAPHYELTLFESTSCGETITLAADAEDASSNPTARSYQIRLGIPDREFQKVDGQSIPPETVTPVTSTFFVDQDQPISELDVSVRISHEDETDLVVELTSPEGTTVRLHDRSAINGFGVFERFDLERAPDGPGTMDDFIGETTFGTWTLSVEDPGTVSIGTGTLQEWTLHMTVSGGFDCFPQTCGDPTPTSEVTGVTVGKTQNGAELDLSFSWGALAGVAGYHVIESPVPAFDADVVLTGRTSGATSLVETDTDTTPGLTGYLVRAVNSCNQEGP